MGVSAILKFATAPLRDMISRKSKCPPYCRSFSWFYEFILRKRRHFCIPIWRKRTISVISSYSEEPVANFNIANLNKSAEEFLPDKKACFDLNLQAINLKFAQIVPSIRSTICEIFSLIALKLRPGQSKKRKQKKFMSLRGAVANFNIAQTHIYLRFQYCLDKTISQYKVAPACIM